MSDTTTRRDFIVRSAAAAAGATIGLDALGAPVVSPVLGANETIRVGFIGVGNRGTQLLQQFIANDDVRVAALCDVYEPFVTRQRADVHQRIVNEVGSRIPRMDHELPADVKRHTDFRRVLEDPDVDAVCIATPDHWHAVQTITAVDAGKDVYVEKPLTISIHEGRKMVEAQRRTGRVVAVGLNRRGSSIYQRLAREIPGGKIGKVTSAQAFRISNMFPDGIGNRAPSEPPPGLDWDLWLGPRSFRAYQDNITPYKFRWWSDYSSQMGNWGVHYMDVIRWMMAERAPSAVSATGGKYVLTDDRTIPDTMDVMFEFDSGATVRFSIYEASDGPGVPHGEVELRGTNGTLLASQDGYRVIPAEPGQFQPWKQLVEAEKVEIGGEEAHGDLGIREDSTANLVRNFLDSVKMGAEPLCPLEEGHRSTSFAHLANIALEVGDRIEWDADAERITNNGAANDLLHYEYRRPWAL